MGDSQYTGKRTKSISTGAQYVTLDNKIKCLSALTQYKSLILNIVNCFLDATVAMKIRQ
jgi:hypothetical protein